MSYFSLNEEQQPCFDAISSLLCGGINHKAPNYIILDAPAGTGKTYTVREIMNFLSNTGLNFTPMAFTGRAAIQLSKSGLNAVTCHSILFKAKVDDRGNLIRFIEKTKNEILEDIGDVLVIDEGSMIPLSMHKKLSSLGLPMIYLGDYDQLPPVEPDENIDFNPMVSLSEYPTFKLVKNERFSDGSGIAEICAKLRKENSIPMMKRDDMRTISKSKAMKETFHEKNHFDAIICGTNSTRKKFNRLIRRVRGFEGDVAVVGERIMCLRNDVVNNVRIGNGELYDVISYYKDLSMSQVECHRYELQCVDDPNKKVNVRIPDNCWEAEKCDRRDGDDEPLHMFTFGYALTCHKCVHPDTLVNTEEGLLPIKEISFEGRISNGNEFCEYDNMVNNIPTMGYHFLLDNGYDISTKDDHGMNVFRNGGWDKIEAEDVKIGDWVKLKLGDNQPDRKYQELASVDNEYFDTRAKKFKTPTSVDEMVGKFIGLMLADGCVYKTGFRVVKRHKDVVDWFTKTCFDLFGFENSEKTLNMGGKDFFNSEVNSVFIKKWIDTNLPELTSNNKDIPDIIMKSPVSVQKNFVSGLFEDGTVNTNKGLTSIAFSNSKKSVVDWVQTFLLSIGIISTKKRYEKKGEHWYLYIYGDNVKIFEEEIGFISRFKTTRLINGTYSIGATRNRVPIPSNDIERVSSLIDASSRSQLKKNGYVALNIARKYNIGSQYTDWLYLRVNEKKEDEFKSIGITVPDGNEFLQNGQLHSNCQGSSIPKVLFYDEDVSFFLDQRRFRYTGCSRASEQLMVAI